MTTKRQWERGREDRSLLDERLRQLGPNRALLSEPKGHEQMGWRWRVVRIDENGQPCIDKRKP